MTPSVKSKFLSSICTAWDVDVSDQPCQRRGVKPYFLLWTILLGLVPAMAEELKLPEDFKPDPKRPHLAQMVSAEEYYGEGKKLLEQQFRERFAKVLMRADRAEVFLLKFDTSEKEKQAGGDEVLTLGLLDESSVIKILLTRELDKETTAELLPLLSAVVAQPDSGSPLCHYPIHGIRLWGGDQVIFQSSICWVCGNYHFTYPDGSTAYVGFDQSNDFQELVNRLMPIPKSESERFAKNVSPSHPIDPKAPPEPAVTDPKKPVKP